MPKKVTIEMTEKQARIVLRAVEEWFRLRMGQYGDLSNDLAFYEYKHDKENHAAFNNAIARRTMLDGILRGMFLIVFPEYGTPRKVEPDVNIASDIWSVLRYEMGSKSDVIAPPFQMGEEPLPKITIKELKKHENIDNPRQTCRIK